MPRCRLLPLLLILLPGPVCLAQTERAAPGPDPVQRAITTARNDGRFLDAEKLLNDAIQELERSNPQSPRLAQYLKELAPLVSRREGEAAAIPLLERAYKIDLAAFGASDLRVANDSAILASDARNAGNLADAERRFNEALAIVRLNEANLRWNAGAGMAASIVGSVVSFYIGEERWVDAEVLMPEETKLCDMVPDEFKNGFGLCWRIPETMSEIYRGEGRAAEVEEASPQRISNLPPDVIALNQAAEKYEKDGLYPSAEDAYQRAISSAEKFDSEQSRPGSVASVELDLLGQLLVREKLKDRAEDAFLRAVKLRAQLVGPQPDRRMFAQALLPDNLVYLYRDEGRFQDAESVLQRVLDIQIATVGEKHRTVVDTLMKLAGISEQEGALVPEKLLEAKSLYERAITIQESNMGSNDPSLIPLLQGYAELLFKLKEDGRAAEVRARINSIQALQKKLSK